MGGTPTIDPETLEVLAALATMAAALLDHNPREYDPIEDRSGYQAKLVEELGDLTEALETCGGALDHIAWTIATCHQRGGLNINPTTELAAAIDLLSGPDLQRLRRATSGVLADIVKYMPLLALLSAAINPKSWKAREEEEVRTA